MGEPDRANLQRGPTDHEGARADDRTDVISAPELPVESPAIAPDAVTSVPESNTPSTACTTEKIPATGER